MSSIAKVRLLIKFSVGLRAGSSGGELQGKQSQVGGELHVNADASGGSLVAEIVEDGRPLPGLEASNCVPLRENALDHVMPWRGVQSLETLKGRPVSINIKLTNAELFSLWWQ